MIKKLLKAVGGLLGLAVVAVGGFLAWVNLDFPVHAATHPVDVKVASTPERVARGKGIALTLCAGCHYDQKTGGLTGRQMVDAPPEFGEMWSHNITQDPGGIGGYSDGELTSLLRTGIEKDGTFPGPFMAHAHASDEDVASIIAFLRSDDPLVKAQKAPNHPSRYGLVFKILVHVAWKPFAFPEGNVQAPPVTDQAAYGHYLATALYDCYQCHSADFKKLDTSVPEHSAGFFGGGIPMLDADRNQILTANLTPDAQTGIGNWTEEQFVRALREGFRPDGRMVRYPMEPMPSISPSEASAIWAYLKTVPAIDHPLKRWKDDQPQPLAAAGAGEKPTGAKLYQKYACSSCHSASGHGICDLREAFKKYKDEAGVTAFIRNPRKFIPDTAMPVWEGIIPDEEVGTLVAYVRELGQKP